MLSDSNEHRIRALAYEYSQKQKYSQASAQDNWLQAERQIRGSGPIIQQFIEKASDATKSLSELAGRALTLFSALTAFLAALGSLLLVTYLLQVHAPLPTLDSSLGIFVFSIAVAFAAATSVLLSFFIAPFFIARSDKSLIKTHRTFFYRVPLAHHCQEYSRQYVNYFLPFLIGLLGFFVILPLPWHRAIILFSVFLLVAVAQRYLASENWGTW